MGDVPRKTGLRRILDRAIHDADFFKWPGIILAIVGLILLAFLPGCASYDFNASTRAHEEHHCLGFTHQLVRSNEFPIRYEWVKSRPAAAKPWLYLAVDDVDAACRYNGVDTAGNIERIGGCAIWQPNTCTIILPKE